MLAQILLGWRMFHEALLFKLPELLHGQIPLAERLGEGLPALLLLHVANQLSLIGITT